MSDNPFEDSASTPKSSKKGNVITEQVNTFKKMDVGRALSQLRWLNFALGLIVIVFEVLSVISVIASFDLAAIILNAFCIIFCGILCLYELQMKRLGRKFRKLYGFLYTYIGRALYIFFIGTVVLSTYSNSNTMGFLYLIVSIIMIIDSIYNVLIIFFHPAFKNGNRKITDDPTVAYSAGESEIANVLKKNPNLAQKMLVGASKLAT